MVFKSYFSREKALLCLQCHGTFTWQRPIELEVLSQSPLGASAVLSLSSALLTSPRHQPWSVFTLELIHMQWNCFIPHSQCSMRVIWTMIVFHGIMAFCVTKHWELLEKTLWTEKHILKAKESEYMMKFTHPFNMLFYTALYSPMSFQPLYCFLASLKHKMSALKITLLPVFDSFWVGQDQFNELN